MKRGFLLAVLLIVAALVWAFSDGARRTAVNAWLGEYPAWQRISIIWGAAPPASQQRGGPRRGPPGAGGLDNATPVLAEAVKQQDVPVTVDAVGTVQALNSVIVRAQVEGRLLEVAFREGQEVKKGDVLARIDPTTYQAAYDQAVAKKAQDEALLANAKADLERYNRLARGEYGSRQQADTQQATVAQLTAQVASDQAAIDNARAILDYTTVRAPIDGRTGIRAVDEGNIVRASDANGLVTITQIQPIALILNLPQQQLRALGAAMSRGAVEVQALDSDGATVIDRGMVEVIDNLVDQTTGTVRVKASFPNARRQLWPGQFINVRLFVDVLRQATTVPSSAIQRGPQGAYVYVVGDDSRVRMTAVAISRQDEALAVLTSGVEPGVRVVTTGFARLTDGSQVRVEQPAASDNAPVNPYATSPRRPPGAANAPAGQQGAPSGPQGAAPGQRPQRPDDERRQRRDGQGGEQSGQGRRPAGDAPAASRPPAAAAQ